jgi:PadR family transcriptional regulator PadR
MRHTAWLREQVFSLDAQGREYLDEFWRTWSFLAGRIEQLREGGS